jgi:hypothetical protein
VIPVEKKRLFKSLSTQDVPFLLDLLSRAYDQMGLDQRQRVFGNLVKKPPPESVDGEVLLGEVENFRRESLAGAYYKPFDVNSKNWTYIPEETREWFERLGDLLKASCCLTAQGDHLHAVACFGILYELIGTVERGEEIAFGDEIGSWMIPGDEKQYVAAYVTSLAVTATPEKFTAAALSLIQRDRWQSFATQAYPAAIQAAKEAQRTHLEADIKRQNIHTEPR